MSRGVLSLGRAMIGLFYKGKSKGYCAFCKTSRTYSHKKHLYVHETMLLVLASFIFGSAIWKPYDPRAIIIFAILFGSGEVFNFLRWRMGIVCKHCGFDPVLYNVSPTRAREKVRSFYEDQIHSPRFMLSQSPLLEVRKTHLEQERLRLKLQRVKAQSKEKGVVPSPKAHPPASL